MSDASRRAALGLSEEVSEPRFAPVVAIEVEGLLSVPVTHPGQATPPTYLETQITLRRQAYPEKTQAEPPWDARNEWVATHRISRLGLAWVRGLLERRIEVVWASTWLTHAHTYFGRLLGLPELRSVLFEEDWKGVSIGDMKVQQIGRQFDGRPLLWVTDALPITGRRALEQARRPRDRATTHTHLVPWSSGLAMGDITAMDSWLELAGTPERHQELRRLRRRDLDRARRRGAIQVPDSAASLVNTSPRVIRRDHAEMNAAFEIVQEIRAKLMKLVDEGVSVAALGSAEEIATDLVNWLPFPRDDDA